MISTIATVSPQSTIKTDKFHLFKAQFKAQLQNIEVMQSLNIRIPIS